MLAEYTAEGVTAPLLTVRKGPHKLITSPEDPPLLFDLDADPDETRILAGDPGAAGIWDMPALDRPARETQAARRSQPAPTALGTTSPCGTPRRPSTARAAIFRTPIRAA